MIDARSGEIRKPLVHIVDADDSSRQSLITLLDCVDIRCTAYAGSMEFLERYDGTRPCCLVSAMRLPLLSGLQLLNEVRARGYDMPVILLSAYADVTTAVRAMRMGAEDFMLRPVNGQTFIDRVQECLARDRCLTDRSLETRRLKKILASLTQREYEVLHLFMQDLSSRDIATHLDISIKTVQIHRAHIMEKTGCDSVLAMYRKLGELVVPPENDDTHGSQHASTWKRKTESEQDKNQEDTVSWR